MGWPQEKKDMTEALWFFRPGILGRSPLPMAWPMFSPDRAKDCRPPRTCQLKAQQNPWTGTPPTTLHPLNHHPEAPPIVVPISVSSLIITFPLPHHLEPSR